MPYLFHLVYDVTDEIRVNAKPVAYEIGYDLLYIFQHMPPKNPRQNLHFLSWIL